MFTIFRKITVFLIKNSISLFKLEIKYTLVNLENLLLLEELFDVNLDFPRLKKYFFQFIPIIYLHYTLFHPETFWN